MGWEPERHPDPGHRLYGGRQKLWWRCEQRPMCGRQCTRAGERRLPLLRRQAPWPRFNDLASRFLTLAKGGTPPRTGTSPRTKSSGQQPPGVVAVCCNRHVWDARVKSRAARRRLPLRQPARGRGQRFGRPIPRPGRPVAPHQEWGPAAPGRGGRQPPEGLVAVPQGPCVAGGHCLPSRQAQAARVCAGKQVVPGENDLATLFPSWPTVGPGERGPHAPAGLLLQQPRRLVAVSAGPQLAGGHQCQAWGDCPYCAGRKVCRRFNDLATGTLPWRPGGTRTSTGP